MPIIPLTSRRTNPLITVTYYTFNQAQNGSLRAKINTCVQPSLCNAIPYNTPTSWFQHSVLTLHSNAELLYSALVCNRRLFLSQKSISKSPEPIHSVRILTERVCHRISAATSGMWDYFPSFPTEMQSS